MGASKNGSVEIPWVALEATGVREGICSVCLVLLLDLCAAVASLLAHVSYRRNLRCRILIK